MTRRAPVLGVVALLLVTLVPACGGGGGGYELTAYFSRTVALYPHSRVKVMGIDAGTVNAVEVDGKRIRVEMTIDDKVPLPKDVGATIVALSLIGERNVVLTPPWRPGQAKAAGGDVIPIERTSVPVEPDEALQAVTDLAKAIDPASLDHLISGGAAAVRGRGAQFNETLTEVSELTQLLASQDDALIQAARNVHKLAQVVNARQEKIGRMIDNFAIATGVLADERAKIAALLSALVRLTDSGNALITDVRTTLPSDLAKLAQLSITLRVNASSVAQTLRALSDIGDGVLAAYDPESKYVRTRITGSPTVVAALQPLFTALGLGDAPCVPLDTVCPS